MKTFDEYILDELVHSEIYNKKGQLIYSCNGRGEWHKIKTITKKDGSYREYRENSKGYKSICGFNKNGYIIYKEDNYNTFWIRLRDEKNRIVYEESVTGHWYKAEYDEINDVVNRIEGIKKHKRKFKTIYI
jgi:hypothetical protein